MNEPLSRETMVEDILNDMEDWPTKVLVQMATEYMMEALNGYSTEQIREQWEETFGHPES